MSPSPSDAKAALDVQLRAIEAACVEIDAGATGSDDPTQRIGAALNAIFQSASPGELATPSLLSQLGGTYTRVASGIPKPPHPQNLFLPLVQVTLDMNAGGAGYALQASTGPQGLIERPRCHAPMGKVATFRQIQAPDWWKAESALVVDHSRITRRDLAAWAAGSVKTPTREGKTLVVRIALQYGVTLEVPWPDLLRAAMRQLAHELLGSAEIRKAAGR